MSVPSASVALQSIVLKVGAAVLLICAFFAWHSWDKGKAVDAANQVWRDKLEANKKLQKQVNAQLQENADRRKEEYEAHSQDLQRKLDAALVSLRNRPSRPKHLVVTEVRETCTGRELYREDAEFLTREAARAEQLIGERDYYYNAYEDARLKLEALNDRQE